MEYRNLGASGLKVSALGLGANSFGGRADRKTSIDIIHAALENGVTLIDTANGYTGGMSEEIIGEALKGRRYDAVLTTKAGLPQGEGPYHRGTSRRHLTMQLEQSLKRLKTDHIDLFYVHTFDPDTPQEETMRTLDNFVRQGQVLYVAASNYHPHELATALGIARQHDWVAFCGVQPSYSLLDRTPERELIPLAQAEGVGLVAYYPLAGGVLTGKYRGGQIPEGSRADKNPGFMARVSQRVREAGDKFSEIAQSAGLDPAGLALAWLMGRPTVASAIVGATRVDQLLGNLKALDMVIPAEVAVALEEFSAPFISGEPFGWYRLN